MFETLMNLVQQNAGSAIVNNPAIPNQQNNAAIETVVQSMMGGLGQQASQGGGLGSLINMIQSGGGNVQNSPVTQGVQENVQQNLMEKLGISPQVAMSVAGALVPVVLNKLMNKAADPNDSSVDGNSILGSLMGQQGHQAQGMDLMGMASSAMADGKLDMSDLMRIAGSQMGGGGGGLGGMLGGLLGGR